MLCFHLFIVRLLIYVVFEPVPPPSPTTAMHGQDGPPSPVIAHEILNGELEKKQSWREGAPGNWAVTGTGVKCSGPGTWWGRARCLGPLCSQLPTQLCHFRRHVNCPSFFVGQEPEVINVFLCKIVVLKFYLKTTTTTF